MFNLPVSAIWTRNVIYLLNIGFGALFLTLSVKLVTNTVLFLLCLTFWQQLLLVSVLR